MTESPSPQPYLSNELLDVNARSFSIYVAGLVDFSNIDIVQGFFLCIVRCHLRLDSLRHVVLLTGLRYEPEEDII